MTETRTIPEETSASRTEDLTRAGPAVEHWLRWSGLVPLPAFLLLHLGVELYRAFPADLRDVQRAAPGVVVTATSLLLVWLPLGLHLALGTWLLAGNRSLSSATATERLPSLLSRWSALPAALFVLWHGHTYLLAVWLGDADARDAGFRLVTELSSTRFGVPLSGAGYVLGLAAVCTHSALGVHRALLALGYLASAQRRRLSARACTAFGALCFGVGAAAVIRVASGVLLR
jgi:succinate dehydrogenase/fumarate reductase cytochrome b subunit